MLPDGRHKAGVLFRIIYRLARAILINQTGIGDFIFCQLVRGRCVKIAGRISAGNIEIMPLRSDSEAGIYVIDLKICLSHSVSVRSGARRKLLLIC
jgi:hypothetical protein